MSMQHLVVVPGLDVKDAAFDGEPDVVLTVKMSAEMFDLLLDDAESLHMTPAQFIRHAIVELP